MSDAPIAPPKPSALPAPTNSPSSKPIAASAQHAPEPVLESNIDVNRGTTSAGNTASTPAAPLNNIDNQKPSDSNSGNVPNVDSNNITHNISIPRGVKIEEEKPESNFFVVAAPVSDYPERTGSKESNQSGLNANQNFSRSSTSQFKSKW